MSTPTTLDPRLREPAWDGRGDPRTARRVRMLALLALPLAAWYFTWLLAPGRAGNPLLYGILLAAECFNLVQAVGFWWTSCRQRARRALPPAGGRRPAVDVFVPVYDEPVEIVEPTIVAALGMRGARVSVWLLDDGGSPEMEAMARRHGAAGAARARSRSIWRSPPPRTVRRRRVPRRASSPGCTPTGAIPTAAGWRSRLRCGRAARPGCSTTDRRAAGRC